MTALSFIQAPAARQVGLVMTRTNHELMAFDTETNQLHHLNPLATAVWARLDGTQTVGDIATAVSAELDEDVSPEAIVESLRLLSNAGLLQTAWVAAQGLGSRSSRRTLLRRATVAGAVAVPVIASITAPSAAMANSVNDVCGAPCVQGAQGQDNVCKGQCSQCNANTEPQYVNTCCHPSSANAYCWSTS